MYLAYLRVSSDDQSLARQHKLIENWSVKNNIAEDDLKIFEEKVSGKNILPETSILHNQNQPFTAPATTPSIMYF